jgi:polyhydroxybutyrate depolymerase
MRSSVGRLVALAAVICLAACSAGSPQTGSDQASASSSTVRPGTSGTVSLDGRPFTLHVPRGYAGTASPLLVALHGYGGDPAELASSLSLVPASDAHGFLLALPSGTPDADGRRFWNATDACCNFTGKAVDDSAYLSQVITTVAQRYSVDPGKVFVIGHSNGGFMALRLACDHADQVAAVVSVAGAQNADASACRPSLPVSVLQVHGNADTVIAFEGGSIQDHAYPSAAQTVGQWRTLDHCAAGRGVADSPVDLVPRLTGAETLRTSWTAGCADGSSVALWTVEGGDHATALTPALTEAVVAWLEAHPRPSH